MSIWIVTFYEKAGNLILRSWTAACGPFDAYSVCLYLEDPSGRSRLRCLPYTVEAV